jgi:hypothetical protein
MKLETDFPSFKRFKFLLFTSLSTLGFSDLRDISFKDFSDGIRGQVILAGNSYYISISLQIAMPSAAKSLARVMAQNGHRKRFNSGRVYNPVLSTNIVEVLSSDRNLRHAIEEADWPNLCAHADSLACRITSLYEEAAKGQLEIQPFWWPERLSEEQAAMLVIGARRMRQFDLLNFVEQKYLAHAVNPSPFGRYQPFLNEACGAELR